MLNLLPPSIHALTVALCGRSWEASDEPLRMMRWQVFEDGLQTKKQLRYLTIILMSKHNGCELLWDEPVTARIVQGLHYAGVSAHVTFARDVL